MDVKCNQPGCDQPGAYRFTWPGRDEACICEAHVGKLRAVAAAIGLYVQVRPLTPLQVIDAALSEGDATK